MAIHSNKFGSLWTGEIARGCELCWKGAKAVIFITGKCNFRCWYCPISDERRGKDVVYANERPISKISDAIKEAEEMDALGASITGGEPMLVFNRVLKYLRTFKKRFSKGSKGNFHIHLYTYIGTSKERLSQLANAGLDEIRFHRLDGLVADRIKNAINAGLSTGIEIPCIPWPEKERYNAELERLKRIVDFCAENDLFLNLNEFEFSETNWNAMLARGFERIGESYAVKGSAKLARKIISYAAKKSVNAHFCSVKTKFMLQLVERLKRRARKIKKPWQSINQYGYLVYGGVECSKKLSQALGLEYDKAEGLALTSIKNAKHLARKYGLKAYKIVLFPIYKPWIFEKSEIR
ncbi:MAG: radical SAM protein [Candidatus Pacearchaeota archaeon]